MWIKHDIGTYHVTTVRFRNIKLVNRESNRNPITNQNCGTKELYQYYVPFPRSLDWIETQSSWECFNLTRN